MSRVLHYQCNAGISGDMHLGALLDLGVPESHLLSELERLDIGSEYQIEIKKSEKMGISGTQVRVHLKSHVHRHSITDHSHDPEEILHTHHGRHYSEIKTLIQDAGYSEAICIRALAIFDEIARAEAKIHNIPIEKVHFHEVGATDSIIDIVGAAICLEYLKVDRITCSRVEVGGGSVMCAHGIYPVPAPATLEILQDVPCHMGGVESEATTPTGAAILKATVDEFIDQGDIKPKSIGYGIGHKDFPIPNVLRVILAKGTNVAGSAFDKPRYTKIEANIDDMSPEAFEPLVEALFDQGASDVFFTPIQMKKSRPAQMLSVLCKSDKADRLADVLLCQSSTIGVRFTPFSKKFLNREYLKVSTSFGDVNIKLVTQPNGRKRWKSEYEDIKAIAKKLNTDYFALKQSIDNEISLALEEEQVVVEDSFSESGSNQEDSEQDRFRKEDFKRQRLQNSRAEEDVEQ